jgi:glycosyltransferase involved in cell wall biosynthesis
MTGVAHVVARAVADDPHTLSVLALADALSDGRRAEVYAADGAPSVDGVDALSRLQRSDASLLVYHHRGAAPALVRRLTQRRSTGSAPQLVVACDDESPGPLARRDLRVLANADAVGFATGDAGASRLDDLGFGTVRRVPPVVARDRLAAVTAFPGTANHVAVALDGPLVLTVDDVATATNAARVVQAYHVLRTYLARSGHLAVGIPPSAEPNERAVRTVYREVWGLRLIDAWVMRLTVPGDRAALTRGAEVFVTADPAAGDIRHALAAMAEGVAVVAPADASAAALLGDGALLLPHDAGPALVAEAVAELLHDESQRARFAAGAVRAAARFAPDVVAPAWRSALAS